MPKATKKITRGLSVGKSPNVTLSRKAARARPKAPTSSTIESVLRDALAEADTASDYLAVYMLARGAADALGVLNPDNEEGPLRAALSAAWDAEEESVAGLIAARAAYPRELAGKLYVYRDLIDRNEDEDKNTAIAMLASVEGDLSNGRMEEEQKAQQELAEINRRARLAARAREAEAKAGAK